MPKSLSTRLLLIFILGFIVLISLLRVGFGHSLKSEIRHLHAGSVLRVTHIILDRRTLEVDFQRAERVAQQTGMSIYINTQAQKWSSEVEDLKEGNYQFTPIELKNSPTRRHRNIQASVEIADGFNNNLYKVNTPNATFFYEIDKDHNDLDWHFFAITGAFLLLLYLAIRYQFAPVAEIKRVVHEVSQGNFKARIQTHRKDDLGQLAQQVNQMAADIDRSMESKRSLLLGLSHELRTPLTRAKISTEMIGDNKNRGPLLEDISEMESIITELIDAEKLSEDKALARQVTDINALILEVVNDSFTPDSINFLPLKDSPFVNIDPIRVKLLVKNLLKNALQYTNENSKKPKISLTLDDQNLSIDVIDLGVGMPTDLLDRLTEPFYRLDQARQRETGGFGLGLYLCQAIANAHKGKLTIISDLGQGTHVNVQLSLTS